MRLLFDLNKSANFHLFKNAFKELAEKHQILIYANKKVVLFALLKTSTHNYYVLKYSNRRNGLFNA